jgi:hypothetical protein
MEVSKDLKPFLRNLNLAKETPTPEFQEVLDPYEGWQQSKCMAAQNAPMLLQIQKSCKSTTEKPTMAQLRLKKTFGLSA